MKTLISLLFITAFFAVAVTQSPKKRSEIVPKSMPYALDYSNSQLKAPPKELVQEATKLRLNVKKLEEQTKAIALIKPDTTSQDSVYVADVKKKSWIRRTIDKVF